MVQRAYALFNSMTAYPGRAELTVAELRVRTSFLIACMPCPAVERCVRGRSSLTAVNTDSVWRHCMACLAESASDAGMLKLTPMLCHTAGVDAGRGPDERGCR